METEVFLFRLMIAMLGVFSLLAVLWAVRSMGTKHTAVAAWTRGGAVVVAVTGIFGLLLALANL